MARSAAPAVVSIERFFQLCILGLVTSGFLAVAGSGYLDAPTIALTSCGLALRCLMSLGLLRFRISERTVTVLALGYMGFFPLDYLLFSRGFLESTVHLVFFLAVMKILTARTTRDHLYTATISFLQLLAAAILSANLNFFVFLALYLFFAMAAFASAEIRRSIERPQCVARSGLRRFHARLAVLTVFLTVGILSLTGGLFFMLPRTADAAFGRLISQRYYLPGFSNQVTLGQIGEIKNSSRTVMHVRMYGRDAPSGLKWRGAALSDFNGVRWSNAAVEGQIIPVDRGRVVLADESQRRRTGQRIIYRVTLNALDTDALFFAGVPEVIGSFNHPMLLRGANDSFRLGHVPPDGFGYEVYSFLEEAPARAPSPPVAGGIPPAIRQKYLQAPPLDPRIPALALSMSAGQAGDFDRARAIEAHLRQDYGYTLELPSRQVRDPLSYFLFDRRKGHCEYFASAMTVMLRTLGVPARLVNGFQSGILNPISELYLIRASDAHTWVEAYLAGRGWTTFDPTPPDTNPRQPGLWSRVGFFLDAADTFWQEWVLSYNPSLQMGLAERMQQTSRRFGVRWFDRIHVGVMEWAGHFKAWMRRNGAPVFGTAVLLAALLAVSPRAWRFLRMRHRVRRARLGQASMSDATLLYRSMLDLLRRRGFQKPAWYTPQEFAASLPRTESGRLVCQFTAAYNALRFGGRQEAAPQLSVLLEKLKQER